MTDLGKAFTFPFHEPRWGSKLLVGSLVLILCMFGIGIPVIVGYLIRVTQRVMRREEHVLPEWNDLGVMFVVGIKFCFVYVIYLIPVVALMLPLVFFMVIEGMAENPDAVGVVFLIYLFGMTLVVLPYSLFLQGAMPIIAYRFALREKITDALNLQAILGEFKVNWQMTIVVALIGLGIESFAAVGLLAFLIGILFTIFYAYLVSAYMHGLVYLNLPEDIRGGL